MPVTARVLKLITFALLAMFVLGACAPQAQTVATSVLPQIFQISTDGDQVVIRGRYLGSGQGGYEAGNFVLIGADVQGQGGLAYTASEWASNRIVVTVPVAAQSGLIHVSVNGHLSNNLTINAAR